MDPDDPTQAAAPPPHEPPADWPPPPSPAGTPTLTTPAFHAPPTATYPMAPPAAPSYFPQPGQGPPSEARPKRAAPGLLVAGAALALLLAGVVGFVLGVQVEKNRKTTSTVAAASPSTSTTVPAAGRGARARGVVGTVGVVSANSFTITLPNGTSTKVVVSPSTQFQKTAPGSLQDLAPGTMVVVQGPRGQDGSITANMVTIVPPGTRTGARKGSRATTTTTVSPG
jgi:hypothetical protein